MDYAVERKKLIEHMLSEIESDYEEKERIPNYFIESIRNWFDDHGWLTNPQLEALTKFYENIG